MNILGYETLPHLAYSLDLSTTNFVLVNKKSFWSILWFE